LGFACQVIFSSTSSGAPDESWSEASRPRLGQLYLLRRMAAKKPTLLVSLEGVFEAFNLTHGNTVADSGWTIDDKKWGGGALVTSSPPVFLRRARSAMSVPARL
jgi:hypothetical protein